MFHLSDNDTEVDRQVYDDDEREIPPEENLVNFLIILFVLFMPNLKIEWIEREKSHKSPENYTMKNLTKKSSTHDNGREKNGY